MGNDRPEIPLIDPTANVKELVTEVIKRQDDVRNVFVKMLDERIKWQDMVSDRERRLLDERYEWNKREHDGITTLMNEKFKAETEKFDLTQKYLSEAVSAFKVDYFRYHDALVNRVSGIERGQYIMMGAIGLMAFFIPIISKWFVK